MYIYPTMSWNERLKAATEAKQKARANMDATKKALYHWSEPDPLGPASEHSELIDPDGVLTGVSIRTLVNANGQYLDGIRKYRGKDILTAVNNFDECKNFVARFWAVRTAIIKNIPPPETLDDLAEAARVLLAKVKKG